MFTIFLTALTTVIIMGIAILLYNMFKKEDKLPDIPPDMSNVGIVPIVSDKRPIAPHDPIVGYVFPIPGEHTYVYNEVVVRDNNDPFVDARHNREPISGQKVTIEEAYVYFGGLNGCEVVLSDGRRLRCAALGTGDWLEPVIVGEFDAPSDDKTARYTKVFKNES